MVEAALWSGLFVLGSPVIPLAGCHPPFQGGIGSWALAPKRSYSLLEKGVPFALAKGGGISWGFGIRDSGFGIRDS